MRVREVILYTNVCRSLSFKKGGWSVVGMWQPKCPGKDVIWWWRDSSQLNGEERAMHEGQSGKKRRPY